MWIYRCRIDYPGRSSNDYDVFEYWGGMPTAPDSFTYAKQQKERAEKWGKENGVEVDAYIERRPEYVWERWEEN